jgi:hypothetical protein
VGTPSRQQHLIRAQRHIAALRAFHTGLLAETHRHLRVLQQMAAHIDILRRPQPTAPEKLAAAHGAWRQLRALEALKQPWRETHRDFRRSLRRTLAMFADLARGRSPGSKTLSGDD